MPPDIPLDQSSSTSASTSTDAELFAALKRGHITALGALYDRYASLVYGLALRILTNPEEAEDLTQEIFLTLWHRQTYDPNRGSLSSFLTTMTRSRAIDRLRSRGTRQRFLNRWKTMSQAESGDRSPLEQVSQTERSQKLKEALAQLPEKERQVLEIAYYEGLSQSEIAKRLATPLGTVKTWSRQGLLKLRHTLQDFVQ